jgi:hypothetical protein
VVSPNVKPPWQWPAKKNNEKKFFGSFFQKRTAKVFFLKKETKTFIR